MEKQEFKITKNQWPVIIKESDEGELEATCPFFPDCTAQGKDEIDVMKKIESSITRKIEESRKYN